MQLSPRSAPARLMAAQALPFVALARIVTADSPQGIAFFEKRIRPVLVDQCYKCEWSGK